MKAKLVGCGASVSFCLILASLGAFGVTARAQKAGDTPAAGSKGYTIPKCSYCPAPEYSKEGLKKKIQGDVMLKVVVGADGRAQGVTVTRSLGYGLDEKAVETVRDQWKFTPAIGPDGQPAAVHMLIQVSFHLY